MQDESMLPMSVAILYAVFNRGCENLNPDKDMPRFQAHVEAALEQCDMSDWTAEYEPYGHHDIAYDSRVYHITLIPPSSKGLRGYIIAWSPYEHRFMDY